MPEELSPEEQMAATLESEMTSGVETKIEAALTQGVKLDQNGDPEDGSKLELPAKTAEEIAAEEAAAAAGTATSTTPPPTEEETQTQEALDEAARVEAERITAEEAAAKLEEEGGTPDRVRLKHLPEAERWKTQAAISYAKSKGVTVAIALKHLYPEDFEAPKPAEQEQVQEVEAPELTQAKADLAALDTELDAQGEDHALFTPELRKKLQQQTTLQLKVQRLEDRAESEREYREAQRIQTAQSEFQNGMNASEAIVNELFPGHLQDDNSPLNQAVTTEFQAILKAGESHRLYGLPNLPEILFSTNAARLGIAPAKNGTQPPAKPAEPTPRVLPAPGSTGARPGNPPNSAQQGAQRERTRAEASKVTDYDTLGRMMEEDLTGHPAEEKSDLSFAL